MSSVVDWLKSIATKFASLSESIATTVWNLFSTSFSTLWGWLGDIINGISNVGSFIVNGIGNFFTTLWDWLKDIFDFIITIPKSILDGIKEIFIPNIEEIESTFQSTVNSIKSKFGFQQFHLDSLFGTSSAPQNIESDYSISGVGSFRLTFFNTEYLIKGVNYFRPFIRGFMVLLIVLFNVKQYLSFIGQDGLSDGEKIREHRKGNIDL